MPAALPAKPMMRHFGDGQRAAAPGPFSLESAGHEPGRIEGLNRFVFLVSLAIDSIGWAFRCIVRRYIEAPGRTPAAFYRGCAAISIGGKYSVNRRLTPGPRSAQGQTAGYNSPDMVARKLRPTVVLAAGLLLAASSAWSQVAPGSLNVHWNEGAKDCKASPQTPLEVHPYNPQTYILRESLCATFEAPFMHLLIGSSRAMLIDTGDVSDPKQMPLAETVMHLLPGNGTSRLPLLVVHSHRHGDHRAGDSQFASLPNAEVVGFDLDSVRRYYHLADWPNGVAQIDLGDRTVDVVPAPGHNATELVFYDRNTGLLFSGDFLMPGRLLVDDADAYLASANRVTAFVKDRPVRYVLGGHIELDANGETFPWESQYHPNEHALAMTKDDVLALPSALSHFNGFYSGGGKFIFLNSVHILIVVAVAAGLALIALVLAVVLYIRQKRARKRVKNMVPELR